MSKVRFIEKNITPADTHILEEFYQEEPTHKGSMSFKLERKPDYFEALKVEGTHNKVLAIYDNEEQQIAALLICSWKPAFINGESLNLGQVTSLKVRQEYKKTLVVARLFRFFKESCKDIDTKVWFFSVFENNKEGLEFFARKSKFIPIFQSINKSTTYIFKPKHIKTKSNLRIRTAKPEDLPAILDFIKKEGKKRAFVPNYSKEQLLEGKDLLKDFKLNKLYLAFDSEEICATMGLWDQTEFRRWVAESYSKPVSFFRPLINLFLPLLRYPKLPKEGDSLQYQLLSLVFIKDDKPEIFTQLLNQLTDDNAHKNLFLSFSLTQNSPLREALKFRSIKFNNNLFVGYWHEATAEAEKLDYSRPYLEIGSL